MRPYATHLLIALASMAFASEYHVATTGSDSGRGTTSDPLRTIRRASELAQPGDTVTVHAGTYRERVNPPRGGTSESRRIVYQGAPGEKVTITGSEPAKGWEKVSGDVWKLILPSSGFGNFNPYVDRIHGDWFAPPGARPSHRMRLSEWGVDDYLK